MPDPFRDAFGRLLVEPEQLPRDQRIDCLRLVAGRLLAAARREDQWLGRVVQTWLVDGGQLEALLGVRPMRGSTRTAAALTRLAEVRALTRRVVTALGGPAAAARVLQGIDAPPRRVAADVRRLQQLRAPAALRSVKRAMSSR